MDWTAPGMMFTQAASLACTMACAIRRASAAVEHVTRTTNLSVKSSSKPVTLSRFLRIPFGCALHATLQYFAGGRYILFAIGRGPRLYPAKNNDCSDQIWNLGLARDHRGGFHFRERAAGCGGHRGPRAEPQRQAYLDRWARHAIFRRGILTNCRANSARARDPCPAL